MPQNCNQTSGIRQKDTGARHRRNHRVSHADFVHLFCEAWRLGVTSQNILSGFRATGISLFVFATFVAHAPCDRLPQTAPIACPEPTARAPVPAPARSVDEAPPARSEVGTRCSGRQINDTMRAEGHVYSLHLGGFATSDDFI